MKSRFIFIFFVSIFINPYKLEASVIFNEIAWMGNTSNANAEWIELYNSGSEDIDLSSWSISGSLNISLPENKKIVSGGYFLLERTSDDSVSEITADHIYTGALANTGGSLMLKDKDGTVVDQISASSGWPAGDNTTKNTMQRLNGSWYTDGPTPKSPTRESASQNTVNDNTDNENDTNNTNIQNTNTNKTTNNNTKTPAYREKTIKIILNQNTIPQNVSQNFRAEIFDNYGEKIQNGKVIWNFGDGKMQEASSFEIVNHKYKHIGEYVVSLQYLSNSKKDEKEIESKINVKVVPAELSIISVGNEGDPYIEIENKSSYEMSLVNWKLIAGGKIFTFPSGTYIKSGRKTIFNIEFLGFDYADLRLVVLMRPGFEVESVYPASFSYENINLSKNINNIEKFVYKIPENDNSEDFLDKNNKEIDLNMLDNQEANTSNLLIGKHTSIIGIFVILILGSLSVFFIKKRKTKKDSNILSLSASDMDIIE